MLPEAPGTPIPPTGRSIGATSAAWYIQWYQRFLMSAAYVKLNPVGRVHALALALSVIFGEAFDDLITLVSVDSVVYTEYLPRTTVHFVHTVRSIPPWTLNIETHCCIVWRTQLRRSSESFGMTMT